MTSKENGDLRNGTEEDAARPEESTAAGPSERSGADESGEELSGRELEAALIAQDHRAVPVLRAFFAERRQWERSDPRWRASWTAFLWWCVGGLASPAGVAVGLAAFLTLALTGWNAWEFRRQNEALANQNRTLQRQVDQQEADNRLVRRAELLATIYEEDCREESPEKICEPRSHLRARQEAVLAFVNIERATGVAPDLSGADLRRADFEEAHLSKVSFREADLRLANLSGVDLADANLLRANLARALLPRSDLSRAILRGAMLVQASFRQALLSGADLRQASLNRANLEGAKLLGADLRGAVLNKTILGGADLSEADLRGAILIGADLLEADFSRADLNGAILIATDVSQTLGLTQEHLNGTKGDANTIIPNGLERPAHWLEEAYSVPSFLPPP